MSCLQRFAFSFLLLPLGLAGCRLPGRPETGPEVPRPEDVTSFRHLYGENCAGCHGANGQQGAATNLANPEYQAWIDDASLRAAISDGVKSSLMPAFSMAKGGNLTSAQIDILVEGMRSAWRSADALHGATPPPYHASTIPNLHNGQNVYAQACARCHGVDAQHPGPGGSILDASFLALIHPQTVRTTIVPGRPDIGQPDWRNMIPGRALSDADVTDVSAWLVAQTPMHPGQPYPSSSRQQPISELPGEQHPLAEKK